LHTYPVGQSGKDIAERTKGTKYWIAPVRREILIDLDVMLGVRCEQAVRKRIADGLNGHFNSERYGLPFAGDNSFLFDTIQILGEPVACYWYTPLDGNSEARGNSSRLSVSIDRVDSSNTVTLLSAPMNNKSTEPPSSAWIWTPKAA
jgi:CRISPR-associated protein Cas5t